MLVGELQEFIVSNGLSKNAEIIVSEDPEGNSFQFLGQAQIVDDFEEVGYQDETVSGRSLLLWPE